MERVIFHRLRARFRENVMPDYRESLVYCTEDQCTRNDLKF